MLLRAPSRVNFDPALKEHRIAAAAFMQRNAWGDTNYKFTHDPEFSNVADQVRVKMLRWYMAQDIGQVAVPPKAATTLVMVAAELVTS